MITLDNWCVCFHRLDDHVAPESRHPYLHGIIKGHPLHKDGKEVTTSMITNVDGDKITTRSGTVYMLLEPEKKYVETCKENGWHIPTVNEPIKMKGN